MNKQEVTEVLQGTTREVAEFIFNKLDEQKVRCYDEEANLCLYRHNGNRCAVGHLIPDDMYAYELNRLGFSEFVHDMKGRPIFNLLTKDHRSSFWYDLQAFHDHDYSWNEDGGLDKVRVARFMQSFDEEGNYIVQ